ncbi:hypothetical protein BJ875DRAFT_72947 [Amylocarpus encephaloides]|uniref:Uncharacterized protein n=1 Tax=Amylocarpus encephaloides TaxID=45428 RepID=A0A9P7YFG2_9HELO|nr:hypothetical protein BJ875DRAFT_72947 [Amylocarpus encephaloides]
MDARPGWFDSPPSRRHSQFSPYYTLESVDEDAEAESLAPTAYEASTFSTAETLRPLNDSSGTDGGPIPIISPKPQSLLQMEPQTYQCECTERECIHYLTPHVRGPIWMPNEHQVRPFLSVHGERTTSCCGPIEDPVVINPARVGRLERDSFPTERPPEASSNNVSNGKITSQYTPCTRPTREADCGCESIPCGHGLRGGIRMSRTVAANPDLSGRRNIFGRRRRGGCLHRQVDDNAFIIDLENLEEAERKRNEAGFTDGRKPW